MHSRVWLIHVKISCAICHELKSLGQRDKRDGDDDDVVGLDWSHSDDPIRFPFKHWCLCLKSASAWAPHPKTKISFMKCQHWRKLFKSFQTDHCVKWFTLGKLLFSVLAVLKKKIPFDYLEKATWRYAASHHTTSAARSLLRTVQLVHPSAKPIWDEMSFQSYQGEPVWGVQASTFQQTLALESHDHADYWVTSLQILILHECKAAISYVPRHVIYLFFFRD